MLFRRAVTHLELRRNLLALERVKREIEVLWKGLRRSSRAPFQGRKTARCRFTGPRLPAGTAKSYDQNGFTIAMITITIMATVGTSFQTR